MRNARSEHCERKVPVRTFAFVIGTRPEVIKIAPVVRRLRATNWAAVRIVASGQQGDLLERSLAEFDLRPDMAIRHKSSCHRPAVLASQLIRRLDRYFGETKPDCVLAQGDTTTAYAASVAAFYRQLPYAHIEAGLRTASLEAPFPEEFHRRSIAISATLHFAPTSAAAQNLARENIPRDRIIVSGNTVIDALLEVAASKPRPPDDFPNLRTILLTAHRRENFGIPLKEAFTAIRAFVDIAPDVAVYFPVHPNPNARAAAEATLANHPRIRLVEPLSYRDTVAAIQNSWCVMTDSGGLQEEAPALGKPVFVLRDATERPEAVASGVVEVVGTARERVFSTLFDLNSNTAKYTRMARPVFPYGDGHASKRIADGLYKHFVSKALPSADVIPLHHAS